MYPHLFVCPDISAQAPLQWEEATPANTRRWPNVVLMLGRRRRRRANIKTTLGQCLVIAGTLDSSRASVVRGCPATSQRLLVVAILQISGTSFKEWQKTAAVNWLPAGGVYIGGLQPIVTIGPRVRCFSGLLNTESTTRVEIPAPRANVQMPPGSPSETKTDRSAPGFS